MNREQVEIRTGDGVCPASVFKPRFWAMMLAGGLTTVACTRPAMTASTRAVVLPICTMVTSLPGIRPILLSA